MDRKILVKRILLAGASALAMMAAASEAGATTFLFTGSEVTYTVPTAGVYDIAAFGAQGGPGIGPVGGLGAAVGGDIFLPASTTLTVLAGGAGESGDFDGGYGGSGGGGSFVFEGLTTLAAAGGGGGGGNYVGNGGPGLATAAGGDATHGGSGGAGALGGAGGGADGGGGGAGVLGGGTSGTGFLPGDGAASITSPGALQLAGGFGGGGGAGFNGGGGGGGFSGGGGGGGSASGGGAGGGGSYLAPSFQNPLLTSGINSGNGYVTIDLVSPAVPETSTWAMMLAGFAGLGAMALRRRRKVTPA